MKQLTILMWSAAILFAQEPPMPPGRDIRDFPPPGKRLEVMKMWRLTETLDLSEEVAAKFFPSYRQLTKDLEAVTEQQKALMEQVGEMLRADRDVDAEKLDELVAEASKLEKKKIDLKREFFEKLGDILTPEQRARYVMFEIQFKQELRRTIRDQREKWKEKKPKRLRKEKEHRDWFPDD